MALPSCRLNVITGSRVCRMASRCAWSAELSRSASNACADGATNNPTATAANGSHCRVGSCARRLRAGGVEIPLPLLPLDPVRDFVDPPASHVLATQPERDRTAQAEPTQEDQEDLPKEPHVQLFQRRHRGENNHHDLRQLAQQVCLEDPGVASGSTNRCGQESCGEDP